MTKTNSILMFVVFFSSLLVMTVPPSIAAESLFPAWGPLSPEQINDLPPPTHSEDQRAPYEKQMEAEVAFSESLTEAQRQAIDEAFARHETELKTLMVEAETAFEDKEQPLAEMLENDWSPLERLVTWQAALDSDIEEVLTEEQIALYRKSQPRKLDITAPDAEATTPGESKTDCYYSVYYGYYAYVYEYYTYVYAYYGYRATGNSDILAARNKAYSALSYLLDGFNHAVKAYNYYYNYNHAYNAKSAYGNCEDIVRQAWNYSAHAYNSNQHSYHYYARLFAYYGYIFRNYAYIYASRCL